MASSVPPVGWNGSPKRKKTKRSNCECSRSFFCVWSSPSGLRFFHAQVRTICKEKHGTIGATRGAERVSTERDPTPGTPATTAETAPDMQAERARELIQQGGATRFYRSRLWQRAAAEARQRQRNECQDCKARGWYAPAEEVHHITPLLRAPLLAVQQGNLVCLCKECHERRHIEMHGGTASTGNPERW